MERESRTKAGLERDCWRSSSLDFGGPGAARPLRGLSHQRADEENEDHEGHGRPCPEGHPRIESSPANRVLPHAAFRRCSQRCRAKPVETGRQLARNRNRPVAWHVGVGGGCRSAASAAVSDGRQPAAGRAGVNVLGGDHSARRRRTTTRAVGVPCPQHHRVRVRETANLQDWRWRGTATRPPRSASVEGVA
jgi:hypothetical protein